MKGPKNEGALTVLRGPSAGALFILDAPRMILGRSGDVHILLSDPTLSRRHACIAKTRAGFLVEDLGSTNGTFVDGKRIEQPELLGDGARIEIGTMTTLRFSLHDALEQEAARRTYELLIRDPLTQLLNRRHLDERLQAEVAYCQRHNSSLSLLMIDIDDFKAVNDNFGHDVGDTVLRVLSRTLKRMTRAEDVVARYGGEEFVILARGIDEDGAIAFADRVRGAVAALKTPTDSGPKQITVSIGVAHIEDSDTLAPRTLLRRADDALHKAKSTGKDRVVVAPIHSNQALPERTTDPVKGQGDS